MNAINHKFYIVNSPQVATQVHRAVKQLSFTPFLAVVAKHISQFTPDEMTKIEKNMFGKEGKEGMIPEMHDMIIKEMAPGSQNLRDMSQAVFEMMSKSVNVVRQEQNRQVDGGQAIDGGGGKSVQLYKWIRQSFVMASMTAFYGPEHPFLNKPHLEEKFWDFEKALNIFVVNLAPRYTAPRAFQAREELKEALLDYLKRDGHEHASHMIKERLRIHEQHGLSVDGCARAEVPMLQGVLANATTTTFWFLAYAYSMPGLLADLRAELAGIVEVEEREDEITDDDGHDKKKKKDINSNSTVRINRFSVETIKKQCPLMVGTYREVLRLLGGLPSTRIVLEDTFLGAQQYLLKAGSTVQIATNVLHTDETTWGADVAVFNPYRFLTADQAASIKDRNRSENSTNTDTSTHKTSSSPQAAATGTAAKSTPAQGPIYSFGGGANLCPGRHFALIEVLGFTAAMIWALDVTSTSKAAAPATNSSTTSPTSEADTYSLPECPPDNSSDMPTSFSKPVRDVDVLLWARKSARGEAEMVERGDFRVEVVP